MIQYEHEDLFKLDSVKKEWTLTVTNANDGDRIVVATFHNEDLLDNSITISEVLSSDGLNFGRCEPSKLTFTVYNTNISMKGYEVKVEVSLNGNTPFTIGTYKIDSDKPTADRYHREIEAYDFLYDINNADVAKWYEGLSFPISILDMRNSLFSYLGYEQEPISLPNDGIKVNKTVNTEHGMLCSSVISAICEVNATFGHVTRDNKFRYVMLKQIEEETFPDDKIKPSEELYPVMGSDAGSIGKDDWLSLEYEDFDCKGIDGIYVLDSEGDIFASAGPCQNGYELNQNFLLYELDEGTGKRDVPFIRNAVVSEAIKFLGRTYDNKNNIIFIEDYYGSPQGHRIPYCVMFVWDIYRMCNASEYFMGGKKTASATTLLNFYRTYYPQNVHKDISRCKPGDMVFYQFDADPNSEHMGIFEKRTSTTTFDDIEGNTSNKAAGSQYNGGYVMRKNRNINKVLAFVSITFPEDSAVSSDVTLQTICDNLLPYIKGYSYTPMSMECLADPCIEVGDPIRAIAKEKVIYSYCFERKITGIQSTFDSMESKGVEIRDNVTSTTQKELDRLKKKVRRDMELNRADIISLYAQDAVITGKLSAAEANITSLWANEATIGGKLTAAEANITNLVAEDVKITGKLDLTNATVAALGAEFDVVKANYITADYITADNILSTLKDPSQGVLTVGSVRSSNFYYYTSLDSNPPSYHRLSTASITVNGRQYTVMII